MLKQQPKQVVGEQKEELENKREGKGRILAISRTYRIQNTDVYYVESASSNNIYYF
jgi:hypothetical protein